MVCTNGENCSTIKDISENKAQPEAACLKFVIQSLINNHSDNHRANIMDTTKASTKSINLTTTEEDSTYSNLLRKLRKLKIEEKLITQSLCKTSEELTEEFGDSSESNYLETKRLASKLKDRFIEIRDLFEEVKTNTISQDSVQSLDIEDMKKVVLNLDSKIQDFMTSLKTQLKFLKLKELDLTNQINETSYNVNREGKTKKTQVKAFSEIVPSPVKTLINSSFKCLEVQEFQEFMANSKNRCGGWIPYNHDIFKKEWHKYFDTQKNVEEFEYQDVNVENSELFQPFLHSVCVKIAGITTEDVMTHNRWYTKYIYLKERQQRALEKWRQKKRLMKTSRQKSKSQIYIKNTLDISIDKRTNGNDKVVFQDIINETLKNVDILSDPVTVSNVDIPILFEDTLKPTVKSPSTYRKSTKQWHYRCNNEFKERKIRVNGVENILKR